MTTAPGWETLMLATMRRAAAAPKAAVRRRSRRGRRPERRGRRRERSGRRRERRGRRPERDGQLRPPSPAEGAPFPRPRGQQQSRLPPPRGILGQAGLRRAGRPAAVGAEAPGGAQGGDVDSRGSACLGFRQARRLRARRRAWGHAMGHVPGCVRGRVGGPAGRVPGCVRGRVGGTAGRVPGCVRGRVDGSNGGDAAWRGGASAHGGVQRRVQGRVRGRFQGHVPVRGGGNRGKTWAWHLIGGALRDSICARDSICVVRTRRVHRGTRLGGGDRGGRPDASPAVAQRHRPTSTCSARETATAFDTG
eukprot:scaffold20387_cov90-Isochrysis_galbana.AAC.1